MVTKTLKASGGDFSSMVTWEATLAGTLSAPQELDCDNFSLSENVAFAGFTTTAANYVRVFTQSANRHDGRSRAVSGTGFRITDSTSAGIIRVAVDHLRLDGLEIEQTGTGGSGQALQATNTLTSGGNDIRIENCVIHDVKTGSGYTATLTATNLALQFRNNIVYGSQRSWDTRGSSSVTAENNTVWRHAAQLGLVSGTELTAKNNYSGHAGAASDDYWSGGSPSGNNNISSDTSATARFTSSTNSIAGSAVFTSVTPGSEDFRLLSGTNALVDSGATLGSVTTDIIGTSRPQGAAYDVGAFERIVSGGGGLIANVLFGFSPIKGYFA